MFILHITHMIDTEVTLEMKMLGIAHMHTQYRHEQSVRQSRVFELIIINHFVQANCIS